jgi:O-antigen/teichoic acid export membrane protein
LLAFLAASAAIVLISGVFVRDQFVNALALLALTAAFLGQRLFVEIARGLHDLKIVAIFGGAVDRTIILCIVSVIGATDRTLSVGGLVVLNIAVVAVFLLIGLAGFRRRFAGRRSADREAITLRSVWRLWADSTFAMYFVQGGIVMAALVLSPEQLASLGIAMRMAALIAIPNQVVNSASAAIMNLMISQDRPRELEVELQRLTRRSLVASAAGFGVLVVFGRSLITLVFGSDYDAVYWPLIMLAGGQLFSVGAGPVGSLLIAGSKDREAVLSTSIASLVLTVGVLTGGALLQENGAACGVVAAVCVANMSRLYFARSMGIRCDGFSGWTQRYSERKHTAVDH